MRDQYAGDISDMLKYALLRQLGVTGRRLGVAWYYNPTHDGKNDGRHVEYLEDDAWANLDRPLWNALKNLPQRSLKAIEALPIWHEGTQFHSDPVPIASIRRDWCEKMAVSLGDTNLVFVDPDNGLGKTRRHVTSDEIKRLRQPGRCIVLIKFPGRIPYDQQQNTYHSLLMTEAGVENAMTLRTAVHVPGNDGRKHPRCRWFTIVDYTPDCAENLSIFARKLNAIPGASAKIVH